MRNIKFGVKEICALAFAIPWVYKQCLKAKEKHSSGCAVCKTIYDDRDDRYYIFGDVLLGPDGSRWRKEN